MRRLADLVDHPDQAIYFPVYDERKFAELVDSIKTGGIQVPPDVLSAGNAAGLAIKCAPPCASVRCSCGKRRS